MAQRRAADPARMAAIDDGSKFDHIVLADRTGTKCMKDFAPFLALGDAVGDQLGVGFRLADFLDIDVHWHAHDLGQRRLQHFDVFAFFTDNDTRVSCVNCYTNTFRWTLNSNT